MIVLLLSFVFMTDSLSRDTVAVDTLRADTLPQVTVRAQQEMTIHDAIKESLGRERQRIVPKVPTLAEILQKHAPKLMDQITHPFAFKQRKKEKRLKKHREILKHYDQVKTFEELLNESIVQMQMEDSLSKVY